MQIHTRSVLLAKSLMKLGIFRNQIREKYENLVWISIQKSLEVNRVYIEKKTIILCYGPEQVGFQTRVILDL